MQTLFIGWGLMVTQGHKSGSTLDKVMASCLFATAPLAQLAGTYKQVHT